MNRTALSSRARASVVGGHGPRRRSLVFAQILILVLLTLAGVVYVAYDLEAATLVDPACWGVVFVSLFAFWSWRRAGGTFFDPYFLFLLSAVLFNAGLAFLRVLGLDDTGILDRYFTAETALAALYLVATGLAAMHLGALLALPNGRYPQLKPIAVDFASAQALRRTGFILLAVSILPAALLTARAVSIVAQRGYFGLYEQTASVGLAAGPQLLAAFLIPALLCLLAGSEGRSGYRVLAVGLALIYSVAQLALGARFGGTAPLISLAWVWDRTVQPFSKRTLAISALVAVFVIFPLIGATRNTALTERSSVDLSQELAATETNYFTAAIAEFGGTIQTIAYTIDLVPSARDFDYGQQYAYSLLTVMPNVFGAVHPAVARGTPSSWLIWSVDPTTAAAGGGLGFSAFAEAYLNFGIVGAPFALFALGFLFVRFVLWATLSAEPARVVALASFFSFFLVYPRSDSTVWVRPLFWYSLFVYALYLALKRPARRA